MSQEENLRQMDEDTRRLEQKYKRKPQDPGLELSEVYQRVRQAHIGNAPHPSGIRQAAVKVP